MGFACYREIEILRKAIGFEVAFLETCTALEDPGGRQPFMGEDAVEQPAQRVVLLDNIGTQREIVGDVEDLLTLNHAASPSPSEAEPIDASE